MPFSSTLRAYLVAQAVERPLLPVGPSRDTGPRVITGYSVAFVYRQNG